MNIFTLKTQINTNPAGIWLLSETFNIDGNTDLKEYLNSLMACHFFLEGDYYVEGGYYIENISKIPFRYTIGEQVLLDGDKVNKCFTRESVKNYIANNPPIPPGWKGTADEFKNLVLATPDDKLNDFIALYGLNVPALEEPTGYRDTLKILRTTVEDLEYAQREADKSGYYRHGQVIDAFDFLKEHLENHVSELDNSGFSVATLKNDVIVFKAGAMIIDSTMQGT